MHRSSPCPASYPHNTCTENISNTIEASTFSRHRFDRPESPRSIDPPNPVYFLRRSSDDNCPLPGRKSMLVPKRHHPGTRGEVRKEGERGSGKESTGSTVFLRSNLRHRGRVGKPRFYVRFQRPLHGNPGLAFTARCRSLSYGGRFMGFSPTRRAETDTAHSAVPAAIPAFDGEDT